MPSKIILSALLGLALADQTVLDVPLVGHDDTLLFASVVAADAKATTLAVACPKSTDCGLFPKETIVYGSSTYNIDMSDPNTDFTATIDCSFGTPSIVCKETAGGSEANFPGSSTTSYDATEFANAKISVTAGANLLGSAGSGGATGVVSTTATSSAVASAIQSTTPTARSESASGSPIASQTKVATTTVSTGAAASNGVGLVGAVLGTFGARFLLRL